MEGLYNWVGNIAFYLIFISVAGNLLPNKKYEKYLKLFAGMVLILLVLKPLTGSLRLEDKIAYYFESITFQKSSEDLQKELTGMEERRFNQMIDSYENAVAEDIGAMAEDLELYPVLSEITIESDREKPEFGKVIHVRMTVSGKPKEEVQEIQSVEPVEVRHEPVNVGDNATQSSEAEVEVADSQISGEALNKLRRKVEEYYGLQTMDVEIQLEEQQG